MAALLVCAGLASCKKAASAGEGSPVNVTVQLSLDPCYVEGNTSKFPSFSTDSEAGLAVSGQKGSWSANLISKEYGMFSFREVTGVKSGSTILCWSNFGEADARWEGGRLIYTVPELQDGVLDSHVMAGTGICSLEAAGTKLTLSEPVCVMYIGVKQGYNTITGLSLKSGAGENIAGAVSYNPESDTYEAGCSEIEVALSTPLDTRVGDSYIAVQLAPGTLLKGYEIKLKTVSGVEVPLSSTDTLALPAGGRVYTSLIEEQHEREFIYCGESKVTMFKPGKCSTSAIDPNSVTWQWDATTISSTVGQRMDHIDDAKIVSSGTQLLVTSSYNWAALLEIDSRKLLFWTAQCTDAHSADLLPDDCIAVACSTGGDAVHLYKKSQPNSVIASYPLTSAHAVVWNPSTQRLYCTGGTVLQIYKLENSATATPSLYLENTVSTTGYVSGNHDMTLIDNDHLIIGGKGAAVYEISTGKFTALSSFSKVEGMKSINVNPETGEAWYTYATAETHEGTQDWSSWKMRHLNNYKSGDGTSPDSYITVGGTTLEQDIYKVRIRYW